MPNSYDHVDFRCWDRDSKEYEKICVVSLVDGKLQYEGKHAKEVKEMIDSNEKLKPFFEMNPYSVLARLPHEYQGSYFYATDVIEASIL